jgi:hypothetical protein
MTKPMAVQPIEKMAQAAMPMLPLMPSPDVQNIGPLQPKPRQSKARDAVSEKAAAMREKSLQQQQAARRKLRNLND